MSENPPFRFGDRVRYRQKYTNVEGIGTVESAGKCYGSWFIHVRDDEKVASRINCHQSLDGITFSVSPNRGDWIMKLEDDPILPEVAIEDEYKEEF